MPSPTRRKPASPYARQILGVRLRTGTTPPRQLTMTDYRATLMHAIERGHIRAGQGSYTGGWRWHQPHGRGITVTRRIEELIAAGWVQREGAHLGLTAAGVEALAKAHDERTQQ